LAFGAVNHGAVCVDMRSDPASPAARVDSITWWRPMAFAVNVRSTKLSKEHYEIVRRHPEQGARLVARIDGYRPLALGVPACH
jgi:hypothetical protein